jgi:integrative and conjugative element protein (TIGR02256 family)
MGVRPVLWFSRQRSRLLVHHAVVAKFDAMVAQCANKLETGGILLGSFRGPHLEVLDYTTAGHTDLEGAFDFIRQDSSHQRRALRAWTASAKTVTFVGEWHTHPSGPPTPSSLDVATWRNLVRTQRYAMVFMVISPEGWSTHLLLPRFGSRLWRLSKIEDGALGQVFE